MLCERADYMLNGINVNISHAFYYPNENYISREAFLSEIKKLFSKFTVYDENLQTDDQSIKDMQTAQRFLKGGGQTYRVSRVFVEDYSPKSKDFKANRFYMMISHFEESNIISISFHYSMNDISSDEVIAIRQCGAFKEYEFSEGNFSFASLADELAKKLKLDFRVELSFLCEITKLNECKTIEEIEEKHSNLLYGFLTGDEGYAFVPQNLVHERLSLNWGSRNFIKIYASRQSFLFINLLHSQNRENYLERQIQYGTGIYGSCDDYFKMNDCPLTVNHGILFSVEFVMILKALINKVLSFQTEYKENKRVSYYKRIRETRNFRRKIIKVLEKVEETQIAEIGELSAVLMTSQHIAPIVEQVKYLLELLEGDLSLVYSERNNILVTVLTVLGLLLALWQILLAF